MFSHTPNSKKHRRKPVFAYLDIDVQIGKSLPPPEETIAKPSVLRDDRGRFIKGEKELPEGITRHEAYITRQMAKHPEIVEQVKKESLHRFYNLFQALPLLL